MRAIKGQNVSQEYKDKNMIYDPKRTSCEQKLKHALHQWETFSGLYAGVFLENKKLKERVRRLKKAQHAAFLPFKGFVI